MRYEYDDEQSVDGAWDDGKSMASQPSREGESFFSSKLVTCAGRCPLTVIADDAMSIARTFGVKSRAGNSLRHHGSFDSSLRQNIPTPGSSVGPRQSNLSPTPAGLPSVPPRSPARRRGNSLSLASDESSSVVGISRPAQLHQTPSFGQATFANGDHEAMSGEDGSGTPRSTTPASSFYARPRRQQPSLIAPRDSSLHNGGTDESTLTPRADRRLPSDLNWTSDEGYDSLSNSTGSHSLRSQPPIPVDANLRSVPGVVGLGDGWAGGPQNQSKRRKLWFLRRPKATKEDEDPLALWAIQENGNGGDAQDLKAGQKKGGLKEAWNRSISKLGSMPALVSGEQLNGDKSKTSTRQGFSRSRLDLVKEDKSTVASADKQEEKKTKRRSVAFFGMSKSQLDVSSPRAPNTRTVSSPIQPVSAQSQSQPPPSPSPAPRAFTAGLSNSDRPRDLTSLTPLSVPSRESRRVSAPLSAPAGPGGLPPPWRPQSYMIPRPEPSIPAPRPFSRHDDRQRLNGVADGSEGLSETAPAMSYGSSGDPQTSISTASIETPVTGSADRSLKHKHSALLASEEPVLSGQMRDSPISTVPLAKPASSRAQTPVYSMPREGNSTPGLDTLKDWAAEGKRPASRLFSPARTPTLRSREVSQTTQSSKRTSVSLFDRLKQAWAVPETPSPREAFAPAGMRPDQSQQDADMEVDKQLPEVPARTPTPLNMPGAYPIGSPELNAPLPPSPYDITQAVAQQMLATPPPTRPVSAMSTRKRTLSGDIWPRRLTRIHENTGNDNQADSRPTSRQDKRRSVSALAGRFGFTSMRRNSLRAEDALEGRNENYGASVTSFQTTPISMPALENLDLGEDDLGLEDILDEDRRMSMLRDLEAALPLPPVREPVSDTSSPPTSSSATMSVNSSEATVLGAPINLEAGSGLGHRSHPSTSTTFSAMEQDETVMTPAQLRQSLEGRRSPRQSDEIERTFSGQQWPSRGHRRGTSMGSIGELAHDMLHNKQSPVLPSKRDSVVFEVEDEDRSRHREREARTMSFASGISSVSSAMSLDDEEASKSGAHHRHAPFLPELTKL